MTKGSRMTLPAIAAAGAIVGLTAGPAAAASIVSLDVGQPKAEIATTLSVRTIAETTGGNLYVRYRATGGPPCAPDRFTDPGTRLGSTVDVPVGDTTARQTVTFTSPGSFQWCAWIMDGTSSIVRAASSGTFIVASPVGAISGVVAPTPAPRARNFLVTISGSSEVSRSLIWRLRPAGQAPCAATPATDPGSDGFDDLGTVLGVFSTKLTLNIPAYGAYRLCTWVARDKYDIEALGVNETPILVPAPKVTSIRVSASPGSARRTTAFRVSAFVSSRAGSPTGRCEFSRRVNGRWQFVTAVRFSAGQACRARVRSAELGQTLFRVRYLPTGGFAASTGFSGRVLVRR